MSGKCKRCQGNGEIVTDWDRYLDPHTGDVGDEAVAECPDCGGEGVIDQTPPQAEDAVGFHEAIAIIEARLPLYTDIGQINALRECISSMTPSLSTHP